MEKDKIFFVKEGRGLTATSANHVANMAKEMVRTTSERLANLRFYSTSVSLLESTDGKTVQIGNAPETLASIAADVRLIGKANSLIAWLREAIKAKEQLIRETEHLSLEKYAKQEGIELPEMPEREEPMADDDFLAGLSIDERCRYYSLEAMAAAIGDQVHPAGSFAKARVELARILSNPNSVEGDGRDTLIYTYTPTVDQQLVDDCYFDLQARHRDLQSKLNLMKTEMQRTVILSRVKCSSDYREKLEKYNSDYELLSAQLKKYINEKVKEYSALKIAIPESLEEIYQTVSRIGKGKDGAS